MYESIYRLNDEHPYRLNVTVSDTM
jgi:hypothetical protein